MKCAPYFGALHQALRFPGLSAGTSKAPVEPRPVHAQTLVAAALVHFVWAPRFEPDSPEGRFLVTLEELSGWSGMLPATIKTALKNAAEAGLVSFERSSVKGCGFWIQPIWPPTPKGGV